MSDSEDQFVVYRMQLFQPVQSLIGISSCNAVAANTATTKPFSQLSEQNNQPFTWKCYESFIL